MYLCRGVPWRAGRRAQFWVFTRARPPHSVDLLHSLSTAVALVLSLQTADLQVGFGLGPLLLLLSVRWLTGPVMLGRLAAFKLPPSFPLVSMVLGRGGTGLRVRRLASMLPLTGREEGRPVKLIALDLAGRGRLRVLNAPASVGCKETLFGAAGVQAVFATASAWDGFDGDARGLGGFAHSGRAAGDGGASCCQDGGGSGGRRFLVTEGGAGGGFDQTWRRLAVLDVPASVGAWTLETRCLDGHFHLVNCLSVSFRNYKEREKTVIKCHSYVHVPI